MGSVSQSFGKPIFGPFWKFLYGQKSGFTSTFFRVFHFHAHFFFHGHAFQFFSQVRILLFQGHILEFENKSIICGYEIVFIWKTGIFFSPVLFKSFSDFFSGTFFHANYFSIFSMVRFFYGKKMIKVVAVAEVGDKFLSRSPTSAAGYFWFCRGRRSRRQILVAVADFGRRLFWSLSRSPKSATKNCRGRRLRPPVIFQFVAVAEVGDKNLSRSPTSAAGYFSIRRGRRSGRQKSVAVADFGRRLFSNSSRSPKWATKFCRGRRLRSR